MNHNLKEILCIVALLTAFLVAYAGVEYKGGGKPPDKGGYAQQDQMTLDEVEQIRESVKNGVCLERDVVANAPPEVREHVRGYQNGGGNLPASSEEALNNESCQPLDYGKSFLHDFNEKVADICNQSPETRSICYAAAFVEYIGGLPKGTVLNVDGEHNLKIVCSNGEEYVFDKDGKIIPRGINEGTFNISDPEDWVGHVQNDIIAAILKLPDKSSLTQEECVKSLEEYIARERAREKKVKNIFAGKTSLKEGTIKGVARASQRTNTVNDIQEPESIGSNSVGVRGWCNCGDNHGKRYIVGDMFCMYDKLKCDLAYTMCARCGCVVRPKDCVGNGLQIVDLNLYRELKRRNGGRLAWSDAFRPLKTRQSEIEAMPNGQIIVGGVCVCKETDPIKVGFTNKITGEFFVCCLCGRVREPDRNGDMPTGTTALSEMGLHEQAEKAGERIGNWLEGRSK